MFCFFFLNQRIVSQFLIYGFHHTFEIGYSPLKYVPRLEIRLDNFNCQMYLAMLQQIGDTRSRCWFYRGGKTGEPGEKPSKHRRDQLTLLTRVPVLSREWGYFQVVTHPSTNPVKPGLNSRSQRWEVPLRHPSFPEQQGQGRSCLKQRIRES